MKHYKQWDKKIKLAFFLRVFAILCTVAILVAVIAARGQIGLIIVGGGFIATIIALVLILCFEVFTLYRLLIKVDKLYDRRDKLSELDKDPVFVDDTLKMKKYLADYELEVVPTIKKVGDGIKVSKKLIQEAIDKTEEAVKELQIFIDKYPSVKRDPRKQSTRIKAFNKRIEILQSALDKE